MDGRGVDGEAQYRNSVSGEAVLHGALVQAARIQSITFNNSPAPVGPAPAQVPVPLRGFENRRRELALLSAVLSSAEPGGLEIALVTGLGGVGKSELVGYWVKHHLKEAFPDGQLYVDLGELRRDGAVDPGAVAAGFLRALHVPESAIPAGLAERSAKLRSVTSRCRVLMVVDDAQHAAEVRPLLPANGLVVVTSRKRIAGLVMDGAVPIEVEPLDATAGLRLVRRWRASADEAAAGELVELCGGLPLLMRAAGKWLIERPDLDLTDVVQLLSRNREEALASVFDSVLDVLPAHAQHMYELLGHCPGTTFTTSMATALGGQRVDEALADLLNAHLAAPASRRGHFAFHDLVREHARARADRMASANRPIVLRALTDHFTSLAIEADRLLMGSGFRFYEEPSRSAGDFDDSAQAAEWLDTQRPNLMAVLRAATDEGWHGAVWRLCDPLWALFHSLKPYADWIEACQLAIEAAQWDGRLDVEVAMRNRLARAHYELGELDRAQEQLDQAEPLLDAVTDGRLRGMIWETRGLMALARSQPEEGARLFVRAIEDNRQEGDEHGVAVQTYNLGQALLAARRLDEALSTLGDAERIAGDAMRSRVATVQGRVHHAAGRPEQALESFTLAAEWAGRQGQLAKLEQVLAMVSTLAADCGEPSLQALAERKADELRGHLRLGRP